MIRVYYYVEGRFRRTFCPHQCGGSLFTRLREGFPFDSLRCSTCKGSVAMWHGYYTEAGENFEDGGQTMLEFNGRLRGKQQPLFEKGRQ